MTLAAQNIVDVGRVETPVPLDFGSLLVALVNPL
jgi:hypothetical protein